MTDTDTNTAAAALRAEVAAWMGALDGGDLEGVLACCHDDIVLANAGSPTDRGLGTMRECYAPRIADFDIRSGWDEETLVVHGGTGVVVGRYAVSMTPKDGGEIREIAGRVALTCVRGADGRWRMLADVDNT
ncbi:YybH family protein [Jannaschia aquimarina]|uniref:SnoaL-like domain protein n=1 Tax=Jannaschia aquimarina TaxID=935700 RepID=A0A0D1D9N4_9RHOB|nr:DUF4440 domain-containing protein [Jannaschia aquimarina]KIT16603.1 SnoaL-like domain protein [Jannaschia aquimarina]SNT44338.1 Ketosteroid isomerase homolog [Jannaschia aquimarina]